MEKDSGGFRYSRHSRTKRRARYSPSPVPTIPSDPMIEAPNKGKSLLFKMAYLE